MLSKMKLDTKDLRIMELLAINCRFSLTTLAHSIALSKASIKNRIDKLVEAGIIHKFTTLTNISKLGYGEYLLFLKLQNLTKADTLLVATPDVTSKLSGKVQGGNLRLVKPGDSFNVKDIKISAVPAYNIDKSFHPKSEEWVGYVFTINNITFYHAGDTDLIPEMSNITADVVFLPVSGTYVMAAEDAALAAKKIMPKVAIPMHYGKIIGTKSDAERFRDLCKVCDVKLME